MKLQLWERFAIFACLLLLACVLYFAMLAEMNEGTPGVVPEQVFPGDEIADDTPLEGYGYGKQEPDCQTKILDRIKQ